MAETGLTFNNWIGGELSSEVFGRYDLPVYKKGAEVLRNFIIKTQGPLSFRPGFNYINPTKNNNFAVLHHFIFNSDVAYVLEFTDKTLRFYREEGIIANENYEPYELETPYEETEDLRLIQVAQTADTMYIVHPSYRPKKLQRLGELNWVLSDVEAGKGKTNIPFLYSIEEQGVKITSNGSWGAENPAYAAWGKTDLGGVITNDNETTEETLNADTTCAFTEYLLSGEYVLSFATSAPTDKVTMTVTYGDKRTKSVKEFTQVESLIPDELYHYEASFNSKKTIKSVKFAITDAPEGLTVYNIQISNKPIFPFTSENNYPRAVAFAQGRLWYGGTNNARDKFWGSTGPDTDGTPHYDDFTTGTEATSALAFLLNPPSGKVEAIEWIRSNNTFLLIGTYGGVSKVTGTSDSAAITPEAVNVRQITSYGCSSTPAEAIGPMIYYIQRSEKRLREIKYYITEDAFIADDKNIVSADIVEEGIIQIAYSVGNPDILWAVRRDGALLGVTLDKAEGIAGWHRHYLGGDAFVESITVVPRKGKNDQLYVSVRREINGQVVRYVECMTDEVRMPIEADFYTNEAEREQSISRWHNAIYQKQLDYKFVDSCLTYDGSVYATSAINYSAGKLTGPEGFFQASWVDRQVWGKYDSKGRGGGRYKIKSVSEDGTTAIVELLAERYLLGDTLEAGEWYLTADELSGLDHLEGQEVAVMASGMNHPNRIVSNGSIVLDSQYSVIHVGLKYIGVFKSTDLELSRAASSPQSTLSLPKRILKVDVKFANTLGAKFGSSLYNNERILDATSDQRIGMPPIPFSGIKQVIVQSGYDNGGVDDTECHVVVVQDYPQPCNLLIIQPRLDVSDE